MNINSENVQCYSQLLLINNLYVWCFFALVAANAFIKPIVIHNKAVLHMIIIGENH